MSKDDKTLGKRWNAFAVLLGLLNDLKVIRRFPLGVGDRERFKILQAEVDCLNRLGKQAKSKDRRTNTHDRQTQAD